MTKREREFLQQRKEYKRARRQRRERLSMHDMCTGCGNRSDGLMNCYLEVDDLHERLCPDCMKDSVYCLGCGQFWAGVTSFDFSSIPGYCEHCVDQIKSDWDDDDDEDDDWCPGGPDDDPDWEPDPDVEYEAFRDRQLEDEGSGY